MVARQTGAATTAWLWLPDDTEESVVGTQLHQKAISTLGDLLETLRDEEEAPWDLARNLSIRGFTRRDGTVYAPMPDVCVYLRRLPENPREVSLTEYGPPLLAVEVASPSTVLADLGEKAATYARGGVREYLVFDVDGELVEEGPVWARRLRPDGGGTLEEWLPAADGRWHSAAGFALAPQGVLLRVYTREGELLPTGREERRLRVEEARHRREAEQERLREQQLRLEAEQRQLEAEQRQLEAEQRQLEAEQRQLEAEQERLREQQLRLEAKQQIADLEDQVRRLRGADE